MPTPMVYARMVEERREVAQIISDVRNDLAALLSDPNNWDTDQWPIENAEDANCLKAAYGKLTDLLNGLDEEPVQAIASGFQDIRNDLAEITAK